MVSSTKPASKASRASADVDTSPHPVETSNSNVPIKGRKRLLKRRGKGRDAARALRQEFDRLLVQFAMIRLSCDEAALKMPPDELRQFKEHSLGNINVGRLLKLGVITKLDLESFISGKKTDNPGLSSSIDDRLAEIDEFARVHPGKPISSFVLRKFPQLKNDERVQSTTPTNVVIRVPQKPPERWPSDPSKRIENPVEFAARVYRPWMDAGVLTRQDLKRLDPLLFASLDNWEKNNRRRPNPYPLPDGFRLLTIEQANNAWIDRVRAGEQQIPSDPEELARFANALQYRALETSKGQRP